MKISPLECLPPEHEGKAGNRDCHCYTLIWRLHRSMWLGAYVCFSYEGMIIFLHCNSSGGFSSTFFTKRERWRCVCRIPQCVHKSLGKHLFQLMQKENIHSNKYALYGLHFFTMFTEKLLKMFMTYGILDVYFKSDVIPIFISQSYYFVSDAISYY